MSIRSSSDDGKHRNKSCAGDIVISSLRNVALIERRILQYTTSSIKYHHCTLNEIKTQFFTTSDDLACVSIHSADQKQHSIPDFLTKSINNTLQMLVNVENEYLQACKTGANVKNHLFCSLHHCKCADYTMFLFAFVLSN